MSKRIPDNADFNSFLNDFGCHVGMLLLFLFILFQYSFQVKCKAYVKKNAKSMSVLFSEAAVKASAKPTSR